MRSPARVSSKNLLTNMCKKKPTRLTIKIDIYNLFSPTNHARMAEHSFLFCLNYMIFHAFLMTSEVTFSLSWRENKSIEIFKTSQSQL